MANKNIILISGSTGFITSLIFIFTQTILYKEVPTIFQIGSGLMTCTISSILNLKFYREGSQSNDAGVFRHSSPIWASGVGGALLIIFFLIEEMPSLNTGEILKVIGLGIITGMGFALGIWYGLAILFLIPILLTKIILKILKKNSEIFFPDSFLEQVSGAVITSIAIMSLWFSVIPH